MTIETPSVAAALHTLEDYWAAVAANPNKRFELLIEGKIVEMAGSHPNHSIIALYIGRRLDEYVETHGLGAVMGADAAYQVREDTVLLPDASFISRERATIMGSVFAVGPDIAVEIISPSESRSQVLQKVKLYMEGGTRLVWVVYPDDRLILVFEATATNMLHTETLTGDDSLSGGSVLPEFALPLPQIFAKMLGT